MPYGHQLNSLKRMVLMIFAMTRAAKGDLQFDLWGVEPTITSVGLAYAKELQSTGYETRL